MDSAVAVGGVAVDAEYTAVLAGREEFQQWAKKLMLHPDDLQVFVDGGYTFETIPPAKSPMQKAALAYLKQGGGATAKWSRISGILPNDKTVADPKRRRGQLRALYQATVLLIRRALARHVEDPYRGERSVFWDPSIEVCQELEIAQSKLSLLLREFCGSSLIQVVDCVKVEKVRKVMRGELAAFLIGVKGVGNRGAGVGNRESGVEKGNGEKGAHGASSAMEFETGRRDAGGTGATELDAWGVWKALKKARKWPEYSQNTWANGLGFATYRRLYRACIAVFGKTPHQMEMEIIKELLAEGESSDGTVERVVVPDFMEWSLAEIEAQVRRIGYYNWE